MGIIRLLHLSDLHIIAKYRISHLLHGLSVCNIDALTNLADYLNVKINTYDAVIVSGDIAHVGTEMELKKALEYFTLPVGTKNYEYKKFMPTLSNINKDIVIMPGNHDRFNVANLPGSMLFNDIFNKYWSNDDLVFKHINEPNLESDFIKTFIIPKNDPSLIIICADFSLQTHKDPKPVIPGYLGQGRSDKIRINILKNTTKAIKQLYPDTAIIWASHYPPLIENNLRMSSIKSKWYKMTMSLLEADELINAAVELDIDRLLCGHSHMCATYSVAGVNIYCIGASTCVKNGEDTAFQILNIETIKNKVIDIVSDIYYYNKNTHEYSKQLISKKIATI
jgi:predicted phosphodiesterase